MARTLEELIILKRTALRYLLARESRLLALGKKPVNKKIANFIRKYEQNDSWSGFLDSFNEDLTRNVNIYELKLKAEETSNLPRRYRLDSTSKNLLNSFRMRIRGGRMTEAPIVSVESGKLQGRVVNSPSGKAYYSFQGIPYAKPPLGSLRFKAPQPPEPWEGIRDATSEGNVTAQLDMFHENAFIGDENCLFLNVYTPNLDGEFLPVMVYIHGGAFRFGSGNSSFFGPDYLVEKDVIVVTFNYRCGVLGFLSLNTPEVPGNAGMKDMVQALRWVKENIHKFGGNSGNITVFGESAGGSAATFLTASPLSKNLFNRAIAQSGSGLCNWSLQNHPLENARAIAKNLGCESTDVGEIYEFLCATPANELVQAHDKLSPLASFPDVHVPFGVVVEKEFPDVEAFLTEPFLDVLTSGRVSQIPIMIGSTSLELAFPRKVDDLQFFIPEELNIERNSEESLAIAEKIKELYFDGKSLSMENLHQYFELLSDSWFNIGVTRYVQYLVNVTNKPIYYYKFDYVGELNYSTKAMVGSLGFKNACHLDDLGYLFKNDFQKDVEPTNQDIKTRERMVRLWTNFAKSGNPTPDENHYLTVTWLPITKDNFYYLNIGQELSIETNWFNKEKIEFWTDLYNKHYKTWEQPRPSSELTNPEPKILETFTESYTIVSQSNVVVTESSEVFTESHEVITENNEVITENNEVVTENSEVVTESNEVVTDNNEVVTENNEVVTEENNVPETNVIETSEVDNAVEITEIQQESPKIIDDEPVITAAVNGERKPRLSNEIKMVTRSNGAPTDVIRANDPPEDDLPKNIGVNKFVNFFESLGGKK